MRELIVDREGLRFCVRLRQLLVVAELRALPPSLPGVDHLNIPARCFVQLPSLSLSGPVVIRGLSFLRWVGTGVPLRAVA